MRAWKAIVLLIACGGVSACDKTEKEEEKKTEESPVVETPKPEPKKAEKKKVDSDDLSPTFPTTRFEDVPTVAELEEEAARRIKPENLESELDRLEAEIVGVPN